MSDVSLVTLPPVLTGEIIHPSRAIVRKWTPADLPDLLLWNIYDNDPAHFCINSATGEISAINLADPAPKPIR